MVRVRVLKLEVTGSIIGRDYRVRVNVKIVGLSKRCSRSTRPNPDNVIRPMSFIP